MEKIREIIKGAAKTSLWALILLALIQPFGIDTMKEGRMLFIIIESGLTFVAAVIACSTTTLIYHPKAEDSNLRTFLIYTLLCHAINIPLLSAFILTFNGAYNWDNASQFWFTDGHFTLYHLSVMSMYVASISFFIFVAEVYQYRTNKIQAELDEVRAINALLEKRQEKLEEEQEKAEKQETVREEKENATQNSVITINGQNQNEQLDIDPKKIIYIESMANYADICYITDTETKHATLRITLKQLREKLEQADGIVQCHRAFLVNIDFVVSMSSRPAGYQLQLFGIDKPIPVSRANTEAIRSKLNA